MGWNIGATGETGIWAGPPQVIQDNLKFYVDPGDVSCYNNGSSTTAVTDLGLGVAMTKSGATWGEYDGGVAWSFDGTDDSIISNSTVSPSTYYTGNSTTSGVATICLWFRTDTNYVGSSGGDGPLVTFLGYDFNVFFQNGNLTLFGADDDGSTSIYAPAGGSTGTPYSYTDLEGDNWYFYVGSINNTGSTVGDIPANTARSFVARGDAGGSAELLDTFASESIPASWEFHNTNGNIEIGTLDGNNWYFNGEIGPVWMYKDCLTESERVHNYNVFRHRYYDSAIG
tara:strand:+ start:1583 stop:2434 length:852 start_codon:yes stop_codon:yes gene_type:complete